MSSFSIHHNITGKHVNSVEATFELRGHTVSMSSIRGCENKVLVTKGKEHIGFFTTVEAAVEHIMASTQ